jgi:TonB family protein
MRGLVLLALAALVPATALATVPPPPVMDLHPGAKTAIVSFAPPPARVACDGRDVVVVQSSPIHPKAWQPWTPPVGANPASALPQLGQSLTFSVDGDGAVIDLKRGPGFAPWSGDEQIAIVATWRFAPGAPAKGCKFDLAPIQTALADTTPAKLFEIAAVEGRNTPPAVRAALAKAGDCYQPPRRAPDTIAYPDLRAFRDKTASPPWAGVRYGIDASGAVRDVRIVTQSGDPAFADAAAASVAESRFQSGSARTGCYATFRAKAKTTPAPSRPDIKAFERPGDACDLTREAMNTPETKTFPPAYAKSGVAGWAIVRFDVAPWGQIGNVEVMASQPSEAFGIAARNLVQSSRPSAPPTGYRGCLVPIIYAIPPSVDDED